MDTHPIWTHSKCWNTLRRTRSLFCAYRSILCITCRPLDHSVFRLLKDFCRKATNIFLDSTKQIVDQLSFGKLFFEAWTRAYTIQNWQSGFLATGIYPFNPFAVPFLLSNLINQIKNEIISSSSLSSSSNPILLRS